MPTARAVESALLQCHEVCGSWSLEIFACTLAARALVSVPSMTYTRKLFATYALVTHPLRVHEVKFKAEMAEKLAAGSLPPQMVRDLRYKGIKLLRGTNKEVIEKMNVHPGKGLVVIGLETVFWLSYAVALRNIVSGYPDELAASAKTDMSSQGILWFQDMTVPDPYCILPITASIVLLSSVQVRSYIFSISNFSNRCMSPDHVSVETAEWSTRNAITEADQMGIISHVCVDLLSPVQLACRKYANCCKRLTDLTPVQAIAYYMSISITIGAGQAFLFTLPAVQTLLRIPQTSGHAPVPLSFKRWLLDEGFIRQRRQ